MVWFNALPRATYQDTTETILSFCTFVSSCFLYFVYCVHDPAANATKKKYMKMRSLCATPVASSGFCDLALGPLYSCCVPPKCEMSWIEVKIRQSALDWMPDDSLDTFPIPSIVACGLIISFHMHTVESEFKIRIRISENETSSKVNERWKFYEAKRHCKLRSKRIDCNVSSPKNEVIIPSNEFTRI